MAIVECVGADRIEHISVGRHVISPELFGCAGKWALQVRQSPVV